jgi:hypothetical protein
MGKPEVKKPLGGPRHKWEGNIKMNLRNIGSGHAMNWSSSVYGQVMGSCECGNGNLGSINCGYFMIIKGNISFSRKTLLHDVELYGCI